MQCASSKTPVSSETYFMVIFWQHRDEATNNRHFCMPLVLHVYSVVCELLEPTSCLPSNALELTVGRLVAVLNRRQVRYQCRPRWTTVPCYHTTTVPALSQNTITQWPYGGLTLLPCTNFHHLHILFNLINFYFTFIVPSFQSINFVFNTVVYIWVSLVPLAHFRHNFVPISSPI